MRRMSNSGDEEQLRFAHSMNLVLATCNVAYFCRLHFEWLATSSEHSGIIIVNPQRWSPGELARRMVRLLASRQGNMRDRLEYVSNW